MSWIIHFFVSIAVGVGSLFGVHSQPAINSAVNIESTTTTGTFEGKASVASDCSIASCSRTPVASLGILVRGTSDGQPVTVKAFKFNSDGTFDVTLPVGVYYIYEDNNNWTGTSLTASYTGDISSTDSINITGGGIANVNVKIDNVKPNLPI